MNKPYTMLHHEYRQKIIDITNASPLPAFIKADVLERLVINLRSLAEKELNRDVAKYRNELQKENDHAEPIDQTEKE